MGRSISSRRVSPRQRSIATPTTQAKFTPDELTERMVHRRAVEAVPWGMPAVNYDLLYKAALKAKGDFNQLVYWCLPDWKNQTLSRTRRSLLLPIYQH